MPRNEQQTRKDLIEPALEAAGWHWEREVLIGPGRVNLTGEQMYEESQDGARPRASKTGYIWVTWSPEIRKEKRLSVWRAA